MRMLWCFNITAKEGTSIPLKNGEVESPDAGSIELMFSLRFIDTFDGPMPATRGLSMPVQLSVRDSRRQKVIDDEYAQECAAFADVLALGTL